MTLETLLDNFSVVTEAPNGVQRIREMILKLAVRGKLVPQGASDEPVTCFLEQLALARQALVAAGEMAAYTPLPAGAVKLREDPIPGNWRWVFLGDLAEFQIGRTPSTKVSEYWCGPSDSGTPWVSIGDMPSAGVIANTKKHVTQRAVTEVFKRAPSPSGTLLMSFKLSIGKLAVLTEPAYFNEAIVAIRPPLPGLTPYLERCLRGIDLTIGTKGALMGDTLNRDSLARICVPLPPVAEQKRIVDKVDELLSLCEQLETRLTNSRERAEHLAASVAHHVSVA